MRYTLYTRRDDLRRFLPHWPGPAVLDDLLPVVRDRRRVAVSFFQRRGAAGIGVPRPAATAADGSYLVSGLSYAIFLCAFVPLIFGGKIYNALERVMVTKLVLILTYLGFVALFFTSRRRGGRSSRASSSSARCPKATSTGRRSRRSPPWRAPGGLTNSTFSGYARDKGWGMGARSRRDPERHRRPHDQAFAYGQGVRDR